MIDIVPAEPADVLALEAIAAECGLEVDFPAELARSFARLRVARQDQQICGFLLAWRAADELHLTDLGVTERSRRRGVARALVEELRAEGARSEACAIFLEVRESNAAALRLYATLGFRELDRRAHYYADTGEDAVLMQLELGSRSASR
ncbi:MAG TPA: ribosomal protein S18-alanine N-acetyltransferase [Polyangiaceae bacterium]|nr:ribosomal protein S18-alanine N-acetyltransferase [Polyangiaceae bacterium]